MTSLAFTLYYLGELYGAKNPEMARLEIAGITKGVTTHSDLQPMWGSAATWYRLTVTSLDDEGVRDWSLYRVSLTINGESIGDGAYDVPLTVYTGEPTDMFTGIARFPMRTGFPTGQYNNGIPVMGEPGAWILCARRSR